MIRYPIPDTRYTMIKRRRTRTVTVGKVRIGSGHDVSIQSMTKTETADVAATVRQVLELEKAGCEIVRVAVKTLEDARAIRDVRRDISVPLVADIHFDANLAIEAVKSGADKIRINPGNVRDKKDIDRVISAVSAKGIPLRLGVNSGSLEEMSRSKKDPAGAMVGALLRYMEHFRKKRFHDIVISLKASDVPTTVEAYRLMAGECDHPFHLGVTAAGLPEEGIVRSSVGIGALLLDGIGDTVRVSLTGDPVLEISAAKRILSAVGTRKFGTEIIACPTCGRCQVDLVSIVKELEEELQRMTSHEKRKTRAPLLIAVMGCEVNGPGEARQADIGIAFGKDKGAIFSSGKIIKTVKTKDAVSELVKMIKSNQ